MPKISEIDLGSSILSLFILAGFIATAFVFLRFTIIGINYIKINFLEREEKQENKIKKKDFKINQ